MHHPRGDLKKLALDRDPPLSAPFCRSGCAVAGGRCWRHEDWLIRQYDVGSSSAGNVCGRMNVWSSMSVFRFSRGGYYSFK